MKREVRAITHRQWRNALEAGEKAVDGIPSNHNRVREHARAEAIWDYVQKHAKTIEIDATNRDCVYYYNRNLGNRTWTDYVTDFLEGKVLKVHKSSFSTDVTTGRVSNLFVLYR